MKPLEFRRGAYQVLCLASAARIHRCQLGPQVTPGCQFVPPTGSVAPAAHAPSTSCFRHSPMNLTARRWVESWVREGASECLEITSDIGGQGSAPWRTGCVIIGGISSVQGACHDPITSEVHRGPRSPPLRAVHDPRLRASGGGVLPVLFLVSPINSARSRFTAISSTWSANASSLRRRLLRSCLGCVSSMRRRSAASGSASASPTPGGSAVYQRC